jgi:hypothetical protein
MICYIEHYIDTGLSFHGIFPLWESPFLLHLSLRFRIGLGLGKSTANGTSFLGPQVDGYILFLSIRFLQGCLLVLVDGRKHTRDGFSNYFAAGRK